MLSQSIILFSVAITHIYSSPCTTNDQIRFLQCKGGIVKIQELLKQYAPKDNKLPPQSVFKEISKLCNNSLVCIEKIQCVEAKRGVSMMTSACQGIEMSAGPFGDCLAKLQSNPPSTGKYSCADMFHRDALDTKSARCKLFTEHRECVAKLSKDECSQSAADAFRKGVDSMKALLKC
uniref:DUF19 domain-containing protein n=1 Tax=Caenorhabditis japonica TaxID=281687 RepID=A0A8R1I0X4_CAEJA